MGSRLQRKGRLCNKVLFSSSEQRQTSASFRIPPGALSTVQPSKVHSLGAESFQVCTDRLQRLHTIVYDALSLLISFLRSSSKLAITHSLHCHPFPYSLRKPLQESVLLGPGGLHWLRNAMKTIYITNIPEYLDQASIWLSHHVSVHNLKWMIVATFLFQWKNLRANLLIEIVQSRVISRLWTDCEQTY